MVLMLFAHPQAKEQAEYNKAQKAKEALEGEGGDEMAKAAQFLQMNTAKLTKARDPKDEQIRIKEREAKRKMKGITLQYTEEERVFFSDVAGIGDAKVHTAALASCHPRQVEWLQPHRAKSFTPSCPQPLADMPMVPFAVCFNQPSDVG